MRMRFVQSAIQGSLCALALATMSIQSGCSWIGRPKPTVLNTPPTAVGKDGLKARFTEDQRLVVIGRFRDVSRSPVRKWFGDIGEGMTDALARSLVNHSDFDVWVNPELVQRVEDLLEQPPDAQSRGFDRIERDYPGISHVIAGKVTDFHHTDELIPSNAPEPKKKKQSSSGFWSRSRSKSKSEPEEEPEPEKGKQKEIRKAPGEAIVAFSLTIVDMRDRRVVVSDHVCGLAPTNGRMMAETYSGIALGSYLFWSTPLGLAGEEAIEKAMGHLNRVVPTGDESIRIVDEMGKGQVRISAGPQLSLVEGDEFYIYVKDRTTGEYVAVRDARNGAPLRVRVQTSNRISAVGVLVGSRPREVELRGAELRHWSGQETGIRVSRKTDRAADPDSRRLDLMGEFRRPPAPGELYFVCRRDLEAWRWESILDPQTNLPLMARILSATATTGQAWLMGPLPDDVNLEDVVLCSQVPAGTKLTQAAGESSDGG